jgi:hypothetical protein
MQEFHISQGDLGGKGVPKQELGNEDKKIKRRDALRFPALWATG